MKISIKALHLLVLFLLSCGAWAQKAVSVHGKYSYTVGENENITLAEVKRKCMLGAQNAAIKEAFKEKITSTTNMVDASINGKEITAFYDEVSMNSCAEWIGDTKTPVVSVDYANGKLIFTVEVWGEAREVTQAKTEVDWKILCNGTTDAYQSLSFKHKDRLYVKFKAPVAGYVAIYLIDSTTKRACCMLPYPGDTDGRHEVRAGKEYVFFDRDTDLDATPLSLTTSEELEMDQVVLIFSPNSFTKNNDEGGNRKQLSSQSLEAFEQWLKKLRKQDPAMVIDRSTWITIVNENAKK